MASPLHENEGNDINGEEGEMNVEFGTSIGAHNAHPSHVACEEDNGGTSSNLENFCYMEKLTDEGISRMEFDSIEAAEKFYKEYGFVKGFGLRRNAYRWNRHREMVSRSWVCCRQGYRCSKYINNSNRKRTDQPITRTGCEAQLHVRLDKESKKWKVSKYVGKHSHEMTKSQYTHLLPSYRSMNAADVSQINVMRACGIRTFHIMGYMVRLKGGHSTVGFQKKDLYNHFDKERRSRVIDGDAVAALCYLQGKADNDPLSFVKYTTDADGRLQNLFWADGQSRVDYQCFGDVLLFDTTYKKNMYNKPLVIFSGLNHHGENIIFGAGLLVDETEETYIWVLETLNEAMESKKPFAIVTDGDKAMRKAIKMVYPESIHRLCSWHLQNNATSHVHDSNFHDEFSFVMYKNFAVPEFENMWARIVQKYKLEDNQWAQKMYRKREHWATAYLRDKFLAGIRTTSRCESINGYIATFVESRDTLFDFLHNFERGVNNFRYKEFVSDFKSSYGEPVIRGALSSIVQQAAKIYTLKKFSEFKKQVEKAGDCTIHHRDELMGSIIYRVGMFLHPNKDRRVVYQASEKKFNCDCLKFEHCGMSCSHILSVMRNEHVNEIPTSLICKRWTKTAKDDSIQSCNDEVQSCEGLRMVRYGALTATCNWMCHLAVEDDKEYAELKEHVAKIIEKLESKHASRVVTGGATATTQVGDPIVIRTKRRPPLNNLRRRRKNKCEICRQEGHNKRHCSNLNNERADVDGYDSEPSIQTAQFGYEPSPGVNMGDIDMQTNSQSRRISQFAMSDDADLQN